MSLKIDKIISAKDIKEDDILVIKFSKDFEDFEKISLITAPLKEKLKNAIICLREDMKLEIVSEETMNKIGWYRPKQLNNK